MLLDLNRVPVRHHSGRLHYSPDSIYEAALAYLEAGLSFIPIANDGTKQPDFDLLPRIRNAAGALRPTWGVFCSRQPSQSEVCNWFDDMPKHRLPGLAILGGASSGNLEVIDFDNAEVFEAFQKRLYDVAVDIFQKVVWIRTPRPGVHGYYRCAAAEGSRKLAMKPTYKGAKTLIETKGERGFCVAPPSPRDCHPTGKRYRFLTQRDFTDIQELSVDERTVLFELAREFDQAPKKPQRVPNITARTRSYSPYSGRPGDHFNATADWADILEPHAWQLVGEGPEQSYWRRPGKSSGVSATTNYEGSDVLYVFSANAAPFEPDRAYSKFSALALLEHNGDFSAAAKAIRSSANISSGFIPRPSLRDRYR